MTTRIDPLIAGIRRYWREQAKVAARTGANDRKLLPLVDRAAAFLQPPDLGTGRDWITALLAAITEEDLILPGDLGYGHALVLERWLARPAAGSEIRAAAEWCGLGRRPDPPPIVRQMRRFCANYLATPGHAHSEADRQAVFAKFQDAFGWDDDTTWVILALALDEPDLLDATASNHVHLRGAAYAVLAVWSEAPDWRQTGPAVVAWADSPLLPGRGEGEP